MRWHTQTRGSGRSSVYHAQPRDTKDCSAAPSGDGGQVSEHHDVDCVRRMCTEKSIQKDRISFDKRLANITSEGLPQVR